MTRPVLDPVLVEQTLWRLVTADPNVDESFLIAECPVMVLALRGFADIKRPDRNDFGVWDDAAFLIDLTSGECHAFEWNCDPSAVGANAKNGGKLMAQLRAGAWAFRRGPHRGVPNHFRQCSEADAVSHNLDRYFTDQRAKGWFAVLRTEDKDGKGKVEWGYQAINIHEGSKNGTSSWGCQTTSPAQWAEFQPIAYAMMDRHRQQVLPYVLTEELVG